MNAYLQWFVVEARWEKARRWFHCKVPEGEEATARVYWLVKRQWLAILTHTVNKNAQGSRSRDSLTE